MRDAREKKKRKKNTERRETFKTLKHLLHVEGEKCTDEDGEKKRSFNGRYSHVKKKSKM